MHMARRILASTLLAAAALAGSVAPAADAVVEVDRVANGVVLTLNSGQLRLAACSDRAVRVTYAPPEAPALRPSLVIVKPCEGFTGATLAESATAVTLKTAALEARVERASGAVSYRDAAGRVVLAETVGGRTMTPAEVLGEKTFHAEQHFDWALDEGLYGLGAHQNGWVNYRGHDLRLVQANMEDVVPVLASSRGYALLWDNASQTELRDAPQAGVVAKSATRSGALAWEVADAIDYYFLFGPEMDRVVAEYRALTGPTPLFGKWAYGLWQSKERYRTQKEITDVVREFRRRAIPLDAIVQDWFYWDPFKWGSHRFDRERYPDPAGMVRDIHALNAKIMISVWARFTPGCDNHTEMEARGFLYPLSPLSLARPDSVPEQYYDAFNPAARALYWRQMSEQLFAKGIDAWWLDATEPDLGDLSDVKSKINMKNYLGSGARYLNAYSLMTTDGVYRGQRTEAPRQRVFILTRSAFAGQQRNAAATWSGDIDANWQVFARQVAAGINFGLSGLPYWTTDIGGFTITKYPRGHTNLAYRELITRWFQWGAFCPLFRVHGAATPREMWRFGEPGDWAYDAQLKADRLRYRLMPYVYSLAGNVTHGNGTILRSLLFDFARDPKVRDLKDEHMFGPAFLVSPVLEPLYMGEWQNAATGTVIPSEQLVAADGTAGGLTGEYFAGLHFDKRVGSRTDAQVDVNWPAPPMPGLERTNYSVRWTGQIAAPRTGDYTFLTYTDDGSRLWVDGQLLIDDWVDHATEYREGRIRLEAGKRYDLKLEFYQAAGDAVVKLLWIPDGDPTATAQPPNKIAMRNVYLPAGTRWTDFWTGAGLAGGRTVASPAPLDHMPLHVRAGSIVPFGPHLQYAMEKPADPIELRVYPGADGTFTLYEDEGENYDYEQGAFAIIPLTWSDKARTLTIGARQGTFPGMLDKRTFHVVWVRDGHGVGVEPTEKPDAVVAYTGAGVVVSAR
jgi:alpha-D-xyloside xylohydrolase